jgi:hypothetical protein
MANRFTAKIPGRISPTIHADDVHGPGRYDAVALMPVDTNGFVVWLDGGDVGGRKMDVFPVRVASHGKQRSVEGKDAAQVEIAYSITDQPAENVTIP